MKKINRKEMFIWILAFIPLIVAAYLYPSLPDRIPMHWDIKGQVNSWGGRSSALFIPLMNIGICLLLKYMPKIDPKRRNYAKFDNAYYAIRLILVLFMDMMIGVTLYSSYHPDSISVQILIPAGIGILFAVIGNFMPKFKHNYFVGIKTPWTLANEEVWRKTHRLAGVIWFWGGLAIAVSAFIVPAQLLFELLIGTVFILALVPAVYSYFIFRSIDKKTQD
ncbi:MAG: SdpI family protein [Clostridiales bacterium]|nr:SdpI family protein [Clostridiales bacterium]